MPNRFEQSAPPSIDKIYRDLPVGPFGVSPYIRAHRDRRARLWSAGPALLGLLAGVGSALSSWFHRLVAPRATSASIANTAHLKIIRQSCP